MIERFVVMQTFDIQIDCFCAGSIHADIVTLHKGDILEMMNERKFTFNGWYILVGINDRHFCFLSVNELESYVVKEQILSLFDLSIKINYLQYKINEALDRMDVTSFMENTRVLNELRDCKQCFSEMEETKFK